GVEQACSGKLLLASGIIESCHQQFLTWQGTPAIEWTQLPSSTIFSLFVEGVVPFDIELRHGQVAKQYFLDLFGRYAFQQFWIMHIWRATLQAVDQDTELLGFSFCVLHR